MSAKIYSGIKGLEPPKFSFDNSSNYQKTCDKYFDELKAKCKAQSKGKYVGEIIKFGVADGYALYMVYSMKPLELIHINTMDGYQSEFADLLTLERVKEMIERDKKMAELFGKK